MKTYQKGLWFNLFFEFLFLATLILFLKAPSFLWVIAISGAQL